MAVTISAPATKRKSSLWFMCHASLLPMAAFSLRLFSSLGYTDSVVLIGPLVMGAITLAMVGISMTMRNPAVCMASLAAGFVVAFCALMAAPF